MMAQQAELGLPAQQGLGPRRGANLSVMTEFAPRHAQTFDQMFSRPESVEPGMQHSNTDTSLLVPSDQPIARRSSRMALKGMFGKNRGSREGRSEGLLDNVPLEEYDEASQDMEQEFEPKDRSNRSSKLKNGRKPSKLGGTWEAPALFQAYPRAVKEAVLQAPTMDVEAVLRLDKFRKMAASQEMSTPDPDAQDAPEEDPTQVLKKKSRKRGMSSVGSIECAPKVYILTTDGYLLQYAFDGQAERLPERMMQLSKDSAAFASDAIPGKHWVLQVSQSFTDDNNMAEVKRPSMLSKLGFNNDVKKNVSHFLLVMNSAEDMNTWLVTIRKEIQSLGGQVYRPDEIKSPDGTLQPFHERPHSRLSSFDQARSDSPAGTQVIEVLERAESLRSPPGSGLPPTSVGHPSLEKRASYASTSSLNRFSKPLASPTSKFQIQNSLLAGQPRSTNASPRQATFNLDKALPERPADDAQARIDALGIINADSLRLSAVAAVHAATTRDDGGPMSPRSLSSFPRSPGLPRSPMFPVSNFNPEAIKYSTEGTRPRGDSGSSSQPDSDMPPRQSDIPSACQQASHARNNSSSTRRTSLSGFGQTPELTDAESLPQESLAGDIPSQPPSRLATRASPGQPESATADERASSRASSDEWSDRTRRRDRSGGLSTEHSRSREPSASAPSPQPPGDAAAEPVWGLAYQAGNIPNPAIHLLPPPHPPPTTALPALPPGATPHVRPSSAQDVRRPSLSVSPARPQLRELRRPSSMMITSPAGTQWPANPFAAVDAAAAVPASTLKLPAAPPLTIKERRRMMQQSAASHGPPTAPAPRAPLPPPPGALQRNESPRPAPSKPAPMLFARYGDLSPSLDEPEPLSPVSESWARYLERVGAAYG